MFPKTRWIGFYITPQSLFPRQTVKTGLLPQEGAMDPGPTNILCLLCRAAPGRQRSNPSPQPPVRPPSSEQLQHHLPGDLGCWQAVLRDEICVPVSHFSRHRVDLSNETLECFMCHLPRAACCQPAEFTAALPLGDKRSHKSPNSFAGSQQHII